MEGWRPELITDDSARSAVTTMPLLPTEQLWLDDLANTLRKQKALAERALAQVDEAQFFATIDEEANSLALLVKHMAGNLKSRWTDFLTTDGEKPARDRDSEFEDAGTDSRATLMARWEDGWSALFSTLGSLGTSDLTATIYIRGEAMTALQAIDRALAHMANHVGQIVFLAKHLRSTAWQTLSIPRARR
jgi:hypothetical protein